MAERTQEQVDAEIAEIEAAEAAALASQSDGGAGGGEESSAEAEASRKGWVPKAKYKGDPSRWKDAATFLSDGKRFEQTQQRRIEALEQQLRDFEGTKAQFVKFHEDLLAKKDQELKEAITALRVQRSEATRNGDDELAIQLEDRIDLLKDEQKATKKIEVTEPTRRNPEDGPEPNDPVLLDWIEDGNQWFNEDPKLRAYSIALGASLIKEGETVRGRRFLDKIAKIMAEEFPRKFQNKGQRSAGATESGSAAEGSSSAYSVRDLPPEDLALMKRFIKDGLTTQEKFLKNYFSDSPKVHR